MAPRAPSRPAKKIFHKIGEVCELTKTEPYVLRYWESEFPFLAPEKNRAGQRIYSDDDIQTVLAIKRLLYEEGYTTAGARRRLEKEQQSGGAHADAPDETSAGLAEVTPLAGLPERPDSGSRAALARIRDGLLEIRTLLSKPLPSEEVDIPPQTRKGSRKR